MIHIQSLIRPSGILSTFSKVKSNFPTHPRKNYCWATGINLFTAATLACIQPDHPALNQSLELWSAIAEKTFSSGKYDPEAESKAHLELTGASVKDGYLRLHGKYQLILLSARPNFLSQKTETSLINWLSHRKNGIGNLKMPLSPPRLDFTASQMERWFSSSEIMSRFSAWRVWAHESRCECGKSITVRMPGISVPGRRTLLSYPSLKTGAQNPPASSTGESGHCFFWRNATNEISRPPHPNAT
jgi:hypothetical protein